MKAVVVVIPVFNEEENLPRLFERLLGVFAALPTVRFEVCFVDDHSTDGTLILLRKFQGMDSRFSWIRLSRSCGSHNACAAGLDACQSDVAIIMAADLQDPPELIPELLRKHDAGAQIVWAVRSRREGESLFTTTSSQLFYWMMNKFTEAKSPPRGADVFLADRKVIDAFRRLPERSLSLFSVMSWLGFRQESIFYVKQARHAGKSKWTIRRKILLAIDSFVGFSYVPIRFMSLVGCLAAMIGTCWAIIILIMRLMGITTSIGYASIMIAVLILGGLQMLMLGVLGEYLWRTLEESRRRPRYFIEESSRD